MRIAFFNVNSSGRTHARASSCPCSTPLSNASMQLNVHTMYPSQSRVQTCLEHTRTPPGVHDANTTRPWERNRIRQHLSIQGSEVFKGRKTCQSPGLATPPLTYRVLLTTHPPTNPSPSFVFAFALISTSSAFSSSTAAAPAYTLLYTDAGACDDPNGTCPGGFPMPFVLQKAVFDAAGNVLSKTNVSSPMRGMGYLSLAPSRATMLLASESMSDSLVHTFIVPMNGTSSTPLPLFADLSPLLAPCANAKPLPCITVSTFHAMYNAAGDKVIFAYRVWDADDDGVGNQALGTANADGSNVQPPRLISSLRGPRCQHVACCGGACDG